MSSLIRSEYDYAILGAGAIGSILGAHLAQAGHSVAVLVREKRARQIEAAGLRITGLSDLAVPVHCLLDPSQLHAAGALIVATKTPGSLEALSPLRHVRVGTAFSIQNGPLKNEVLAQVLGESRVLGCLADTSGEMAADGTVLFTRNVNIMLGEMFGEHAGESSERARELARAIDASGVRAAAVTNIQSLEWSKFAIWVGLVSLSVLTRAPTWKVLSDLSSARALVRLTREMGRLAQARGIELSDQAVLPTASLCQDTEEHAIDTLSKIGREYEAKTPRHRMSALQDLEAGRPLEVHETLGYAAREATRLGVSAPLLHAFYDVISAIDRTRGSAS